MWTELPQVPLPSILKAILQVFKQPKNSTESLLFGLGLGLSLAVSTFFAPSTNSNSAIAQTKVDG